MYIYLGMEVKAQAEREIKKEIKCKETLINFTLSGNFKRSLRTMME